ncbi:MAG: hypothetical protein AB9919_02200 [Geobacteraceae bacterium]
MIGEIVRNLKDSEAKEYAAAAELERQKAAAMENDKQMDPWAHRTVGMRCATCLWFCPKGNRLDFGRCRRHAPTMSGYPAVYATDWCGDHKMDESKI